MTQRSDDAERPKLLVCRKCGYQTDVLRSSCPECKGDMIADHRTEE
ncbi:hypothetical protein [Haloarcula amylovorans]|nr:hypothetical protein [Halomicroarcula amylolytica]